MWFPGLTRATQGLQLSLSKYKLKVNMNEEPEYSVEEGMNEEQRTALLILFGEKGAEALEALSQVVEPIDCLEWLKETLFKEIKNAWSVRTSECTPEELTCKLILDEFFGMSPPSEQTIVTDLTTSIDEAKRTALLALFEERAVQALAAWNCLTERSNKMIWIARIVFRAILMEWRDLIPQCRESDLKYKAILDRFLRIGPFYQWAIVQLPLGCPCCKKIMTPGEHFVSLYDGTQYQLFQCPSTYCSRYEVIDLARLIPPPEVSIDVAVDEVKRLGSNAGTLSTN